MKATGIVRRIDDLGRVVIPKEIRRTMRIHEGDPLEIYTSSDGEVIFKKYSVIGEMGQNASQVADIMYKLAGCPVVVFDRDQKRISGTESFSRTGRTYGKPETVFCRGRKQTVLCSGGCESNFLSVSADFIFRRCDWCSGFSE